MTVHATGDFELPTYVTNEEVLVSPNEVVGTQNFQFTFSEAVPIVVQHWSTDEVEITGVMADEITNYTHQYGAPGVLTEIEGGYQLQGSWHGIGPEGAARGYFETAPGTVFTVAHTSLAPFKFEEYRIGIIVPEPSGALILLICLSILALRQPRQA